MALLLPSSLDTCAASELRLTLKGLIESGEPLLLDGSSIDRIGQACLQILAAARAAAMAAGLTYRIEAPSPQLAEMTRLARLDLVLDAA